MNCCPVRRWLCNRRSRGGNVGNQHRPADGSAWLRSVDAHCAECFAFFQVGSCWAMQFAATNQKICPALRLSAATLAWNLAFGVPPMKRASIRGSSQAMLAEWTYFELHCCARVSYVSIERTPYLPQNKTALWRVCVATHPLRELRRPDVGSGCDQRAAAVAAPACHGPAHRNRAGPHSRIAVEQLTSASSLPPAMCSASANATARKRCWSSGGSPGPRRRPGRARCSRLVRLRQLADQVNACPYRANSSLLYRPRVARSAAKVEAVDLRCTSRTGQPPGGPSCRQSWPTADSRFRAPRPDASCRSVRMQIETLPASTHSQEGT